MAGSRGPLGKKPGDHLGHRTKAQDSDLTLLRRTPKVGWKTANPDWHDEAAYFYNSLKRSAQAKLFEPSDVAITYFLCSQMDAYIQKGRSNGQMFSAIMSAIESLMGTEAARRRLRVEIVDSLPEDLKHEDDPVAAFMAEYTKDMAA